MPSFTNILIHSQVLRIAASKLQLFQHKRGINMFITKNKITVSLIVFALLISIAFLAPVTLFIVLASTATVILISHVRQNYDIDYKYVASFIFQLVGLICIVASFVSIFVLLSHLLTQ